MRRAAITKRKIQMTVTLDRHLIDRARGVVKANADVTLASLIARGLAREIKRYEKAKRTAYRGRPIRLQPGRKSRKT
jgi:hypothetical protein